MLEHSITDKQEAFRLLANAISKIGKNDLESAERLLEKVLAYVRNKQSLKKAVEEIRQQ